MALDLPGAQFAQNVEKREMFACFGVELHENRANQALFHPEAAQCFPKTLS
jgi:hypothetical protein